MLKYRFDNTFAVADSLVLVDPHTYLGKEGAVRLEGEIAFIPCEFQAVDNVFIAGEGVRTTMKIWHNCLQSISKKKIVEVRLGSLSEIAKRAITDLDPPDMKVLPDDTADTLKPGVDLALGEDQTELVVKEKETVKKWANWSVGRIPDEVEKVYGSQAEPEFGCVSGEKPLVIDLPKDVIDKAGLDFLGELVPEKLVKESERVWTDEEFSSMLSAYIGRVLALYIDWLEYGHVALLKKETATLTLFLYLLRKRIDGCNEWEAIIKRQLTSLESEIARAKVRKANKLLTPKTATKNLDPGDMAE